MLELRDGVFHPDLIGLGISTLGNPRVDIKNTVGRLCILLVQMVNEAPCLWGKGLYIRAEQIRRAPSTSVDRGGGRKSLLAT